MVLEGVLAGIVAGAGYGYVGYLAAAKDSKNPEDFDLSKFGSGVILGGLFGGAGAFLGWTPDMVSSAGFGVVSTQIVNKVWKALFGNKK